MTALTVPADQIDWSLHPGETNADYFRRIRRAAALSIDDFAAVTRRTFSYILDVEAGVREPADRTRQWLQGFYRKSERLEKQRLEDELPQAVVREAKRILAEDARAQIAESSKEMGHSIARTIWDTADDETYIVVALHALVTIAEDDPMIDLPAATFVAFRDLALGLRKRFPGYRDPIPHSRPGMGGLA